MVLSFRTPPPEKMSCVGCEARICDGERKMAGGLIGGGCFGGVEGGTEGGRGGSNGGEAGGEVGGGRGGSDGGSRGGTGGGGSGSEGHVASVRPPVPQSEQSLHIGQVLCSNPNPPSSHSPSLANTQLFKQEREFATEASVPASRKANHKAICNARHSHIPLAHSVRGAVGCSM